jgi:hypothetical protein
MDLEPARLSSSVVRDVEAAFQPYVDPDAVTLAHCIDTIGNFLSVESSSLLIDKKAVLCGLIATGITQMEDARRTDWSSTARWMVEWLTRGRVLNLEPQTRMINAYADKNGKIVLSEDMIAVVLPEAMKVATATRGQSLIELRHLLFAVLKDPGPEWRGLVAPELETEDFDTLRQHLLDQIVTGDPNAAWRAMAMPTNGIVTPVAPPPAKAAPRRKKAAAKATPPPKPAPPESLRTLADQPARVDMLGRKSFARVLAERLRAAHDDAAGQPDAGAFMAHIHGPWGFGKSSALNFLRTELEHPPKGPAWLVVEFNAWKHQRLRPPWWSLISAVYTAALGAPNVSGNFRLRRIWWAWRLRADWLPILLVAAVLGLLAFGVVTKFGSGETAVKVLTAIVTAAAGVYAYMRFLLFGSAKAAEAYSEIKTDPYQPVVRLYAKLIAAVGRPVAIFIDDLDRCDSAYVVELIEGIQTLLRTEQVTYVVAADRKWICSAFERKYGDFSGHIGELGRPLGYLFLDKLFQISAALPALSGDARSGYWKALLDGAPMAPEGSLSTEAAAEKVEGKTSIEALQAVIDKAPAAEQPALRAAAAVQITRPDAAQAVEHRLQRFAPLLEPNPRAMKRLVNAVGMAQARCFLEARTVSLDTLARWTLIELRWPLLAEYLADNIDAVDLVKAPPDARAAAALPPLAAGLIADRQVCAIVAPKDEPGLDATILAAMLR